MPVVDMILTANMISLRNPIHFQHLKAIIVHLVSEYKYESKLLNIIVCTYSLVYLLQPLLLSLTVCVSGLIRKTSLE